MTHQIPENLEPDRRVPDLASGLFIGIGSLATVALMSQHPSVDAPSFASAVEEIARKAATSRCVHGALIVCMVLVLHGFVGLAGHLGWQLGRVRAGVIAYGLGVVCMIGAALINGIVVSDLATRHAAHPEEDLEALRPIFTLCWNANQALANVGTVALSAAILAWSLVLLQRGAAARNIGILGLFAGALPMLGILSGHVHLHLHAMIAVVLAQALWSVCVAVWLIRLRSQNAR